MSVVGYGPNIYLSYNTCDLYRPFKISKLQELLEIPHVYINAQCPSVILSTDTSCVCYGKEVGTMVNIMISY